MPRPPAEPEEAPADAPPPRRRFVTLKGVVSVLTVLVAGGSRRSPSPSTPASLQNAAAQRESLVALVTDIAQQVGSLKTTPSQSRSVVTQALAAEAAQGLALIGALGGQDVPAVDTTRLGLPSRTTMTTTMRCSPTGEPPTLMTRTLPCIAKAHWRIRRRIFYELGGVANIRNASADIQRAYHLIAAAPDVTDGERRYGLAYDELVVDSVAPSPTAQLLVSSPRRGGTVGEDNPARQTSEHPAHRPRVCRPADRCESEGRDANDDAMRDVHRRPTCTPAHLAGSPGQPAAASEAQGTLTPQLPAVSSRVIPAGLRAPPPLTHHPDAVPRPRPGLDPEAALTQVARHHLSRFEHVVSHQLTDPLAVAGEHRLHDRRVRFDGSGPLLRDFAGPDVRKTG